MAMTLNIGKLNHRISFLTQTVGNDSFGELLDDWTFSKSAWASKEPLLGRELYAALSAETKVEVKFRMRYIAGINNNMRILHKSDIYEIISAIDVNNAHRELGQ